MPPFERNWMLAVAICAILASIEAPLRLVLHYKSSFLIESVLTAIFLVDLIFNLRESKTASSPANGRAPRQRKMGWLLVDLLAAIPFGILPIPAAFQLLRLVKVARVGQLIARWRGQVVLHLGFFRLGSFLFWLALLTHWIACAWLALRGITPDFSDATHYLRAVYWSVTTLATVGYGDITPTSNAQMVFAIGVMIIGAGVYGFAIANVANILANIDPAKVRYREMVERLTVFMNYRSIPPELQRRILDYNAYLWEKRLGYDESSTIAGLPPNLKTEVLLFLNGDIIERVPFFRGASQELIRAVALEMHPVVFTPGDYIMRAGEPGHEMYFVSRGAVEVVSADETKIYATLGPGDFFGEMALLFDQPRVAGARAVSYCDLYLLEKETFNRILARFPAFAAHIAEVVDKRKDLNQRG